MSNNTAFYLFAFYSIMILLHDANSFIPLLYVYRMNKFGLCWKRRKIPNNREIIIFPRKKLMPVKNLINFCEPRFQMKKKHRKMF